jgi:hypothetical protein
LQKNAARAGEAVGGASGDRRCVNGYCRPRQLRQWFQSGTGDNKMSDDLTNSQISLLCDIGEFGLSKQLTGDQKCDLERLISGDYVEPTESHAGSAFTLTAKGLEFLGKRGAGLNEA